MNRRSIFLNLAVLILLFATSLLAQSDSVDVTFFYKPAGTPATVFLPGEFNNWGPNTNGNIALGASSRMSFDAANGHWLKTVRLRVGGPASGGGVSGAYQYKFNENGASSGWLPDPHNPRRNAANNDNSILYVRNPTIHYLLPNSLSGVVKARLPVITAYIFPSTRHAVDPASIRVVIGNTQYTNIASAYDPATKLLRFTPTAPLSNGRHNLKLYVRSTAGTLSADSTTFEVQGDAVQILAQAAETRKTSWRVRGEVYRGNGTLDSSLTSGVLKQNTSSFGVRMINGRFDTTLALVEGDNVFSFEAMAGGSVEASSPVTIRRLVAHQPFAVITFDTTASTVGLHASQSTDPDPGQSQLLNFTWREDAGNPQVFGISGQTGAVVTVNKPQAPGEYFFTLTARDPNGNEDQTRQFFTVTSAGELIPGTLASNPSWAQAARIYIMFFKGLTPAGTIRAATPHLARVKALGFNVIWVLPVMDNAYPIDNGFGIGYNVVDFYNVAPEYGTNQDFKNFIALAHELGLRLILDFTLNHSSRFHRFAEEARTHGIDSPYWAYYQHQAIAHNTNGLGQSVDPHGFYYYSVFGDQLLNWDWSDLDARAYMLDAMEYWLREFDLDGFRLDVYWGPHRRYGSDNFDRPLRRALKHFHPDIFILGEDDGTGVGTELIYADRNAGLDAAYDRKLFSNQIRSFGFTTGAVNNLHNELINGEFYPGVNSYFFRFMETQDEDRIAYVYDSFEKTMPMASALFTAPGSPGIMQGQEVGYGKDIPGSKEDRVRSVVNFNFAGRDLLLPHYQKIVQIRAQFPAFRQHKQDTNRDGNVNASDVPDFIRAATTDGLVYAFARPYLDHNGLTVVNFSAENKTVTMDLTRPGLLKFANGIVANESYFLNDLYNDVHPQTPGSALNAVQVSLPAYGSAIFIISQELERLELPAIVSVETKPDMVVPRELVLHQNHPNPFNPSTEIRFDLPRAERVTVRVFDTLGRQVVTLFEGNRATGSHRLLWEGRDQAGRTVPNGVYFLQVEAGREVAVRKMLLIR